MNFIEIPDKDYEMMDAPVTQKDYESVMGVNPSKFNGNSLRPVESVSWCDAQEFIKKLNDRNDGYKYDLPSEQEWEYCCRAGSNKDYCFGNSIKTLKNYAWFYENSKYTTHQVKKKKPNAYGLYDMHGNVWEWTSSLWSADNLYRVIRGGSWDYDPQDLRSAYRGSCDPGYRNGDVGFRLLRTKPVTLDTLTLSPSESEARGVSEKAEERIKNAFDKVQNAIDKVQNAIDELQIFMGKYK